MTPELRDRLTRLETLLESFIYEVRSSRGEQKEHNEIFFATTKAVAEMKSKAAGAWWTVGIFGSLTVATASLISWITAIWFHRGGR